MPARDPAGIVLFELVAVDRIVEEIGEVGKQPKLIVDAVETEMAVTLVPGGAEGVALRLTTVAGIKIAPS